MGRLNDLEKKLIGRGARFTSKLLHNAVHTYTDYQQRRIGTFAASVSFYAIFSVFPLLAFSVYLVGKVIGDESTTQSVPMVLKVIKDYVPALQGWIEKGLFDVIKGNAATNIVNAVLLGWSGLGLFAAMLLAIENLPEHGAHRDRANLTQIALGFATLAMFAVYMVTVVFSELVDRSVKIPVFLQDLPFELQDTLYFLGKSHTLLIGISIGGVAAVFKLFLPVKVRIRSVIASAVLFAALVMASRSLYWVYLHYNQQVIESTYGVFSTLILIMLWVHFISSCMLYCCLFALHLDHVDGFSEHVGEKDEYEVAQHAARKARNKAA
jgi:membrane protein